MELATGDLAEPYGGLSTEAAIRDWARTDPEAAAAQAQADRARGAYLEGLLAGMGLEAARAGQAARLILMAYTGAVHRGIRDRAQLAGDLAVLTAALLSPSGR